MADLYYVPLETRRWLRKARDAVDALLNADEFDAAAADALAHRSVYASTASCLLEIARAGPDFIKALIESESFAAPYRFALSFSVIRSQDDIRHPFTIDHLRAINTPQARLAMVAAGEPFEWRTSDQRSRAVFTLRRVVLRMLKR